MIRSVYHAADRLAGWLATRPTVIDLLLCVLPLAGLLVTYLDRLARRLGCESGHINEGASMRPRCPYGAFARTAQDGCRRVVASSAIASLDLFWACSTHEQLMSATMFSQRKRGPKGSGVQAAVL